jgi:hypothetical protein
VTIAIAGGSAAGLFAALLLARAGHDVVVIERDRLAPAPDAETAAAAAFRPSAPQIVQPHLIMARCRELLIERLPDVYAGLLAAGVAGADRGGPHRYLVRRMRDRLLQPHYRIRPAAALPGLPVTRTVIALDEFLAGKWGADNGAVQLAVAPLAADRRFRTVRDPGVFTAVLRTVPAYAAWLDVMDPITGVFPMGGLHNTLRRLVVNGRPVATGLLAIGDSVCTTNPTLGRGLALALTGAADLADTLAGTVGGPVAQALAMDRLTGEHVELFYRDQAAIDAARLAVMRHTVFGAPAPRPAAATDRVSYPQLRVAGCYDPVAFRAFWTINGMVCLPEEVYADPHVVACTREALSRYGSGPPVAQPAREHLLAALTQ